MLPRRPARALAKRELHEGGGATAAPRVRPSGEKVDPGGRARAVDEGGRGRPVVEEDDQRDELLVRVRMGSHDVDRAPQLRTLALARPERRDELRLVARSDPNLGADRGVLGGPSRLAPQVERRRLRAEAEPPQPPDEVLRRVLGKSECRPDRPLEVVIERPLEEPGQPLGADVDLLDEVEPGRGDPLVPDEARARDLEGEAAERDDEPALGSERLRGLRRARGRRHGGR